MRTSPLAAGITAVGLTLAATLALTTVAPPTPASVASGSSVLPPDPAVPTVETASWPSGSGDISDDSAIYANATDPSLSVVIGDNKSDRGGGIGVFDMTGALLQFRADGKIGNVDLRAGFVLGGTSVVLVGANNRSNASQEFWVLDPTTRLLSSTKSLGTLSTQSSNYGFCVYVSPASGKFYSFVTATDGMVRQYELGSTGSEVTATRVRSFDVGGQTEGCVADDGLGYVYFGEEDVGIWRYDAEPGGGTTRIAVDRVGAGRLTADVEGLDIAYGPGNTGYLYASSQGSSRIVVYDRVTYAHIRSFSVPSNGSIDPVSGSDGLAVTGAALGPGFPHGALVVHDESNSGGTTSNLKYVPLAASTTPAPAPTASFTVSPTSGTAPLAVTFTDTSTGSPTSWAWDFGDGTTSTAQNPSHTYTAAGTYTVSLQATNATGSDTATRTAAVTVQEPPPGPPGTGYPATVLADKPVGYWRLGETSGTSTADSAGGPAGVVVGGVTRGLAGVSGDSNAAMRFDGRTGYVRVDDRASLDFTTENFTVEAWARPTTVGTSGGAVLQKGNTTGYPGWQYRLSLTSGGKWRATVFVRSTNVTATDPGTPSTSTWTHLVLVRNGGQITLYVNGVAVSTTRFTGSVNTSDGMLAIGRSGASSDGYFNGSVDEVAVYPTALTPTQILNHYNAATTK